MAAPVQAGRPATTSELATFKDALKNGAQPSAPGDTAKNDTCRAESSFQYAGYDATVIETRTRGACGTSSFKLELKKSDQTYLSSDTKVQDDGYTMLRGVYVLDVNRDGVKDIAVNLNGDGLLVYLGQPQTRRGPAPGKTP